MTNPEDLFLHFCAKRFYREAQGFAAACSQYFLQTNGKTLLILLDGYDELCKESRDNSLITDVLNRQVLPECDLIVSSRPHASLFLRKQATLYVDILGFTGEEQKHYIKHSFSDQSQIAELEMYLENHIIICSLCYVPFNISMLVFLYKQLEQGASLPSSATELYNKFICLTIRRNLSKDGINSAEITDINNLPEPYNKFIYQLSKFALHTLNKNELIFAVDEIKEFCPEIEHIPGALNAFGLLQATELISTSETTTTKVSFLHLSVQEFLAANYITTLKSDEELSIEEFFWSNIRSNAFTFYIALTKGQRHSFKRFLSGGNNVVPISSKFLDDKLKCLHLYKCFYKTNSDNEIMCNLIEEKFSDRIIYFVSMVLATNDIENIAVFLTCCSIKQWKKLELDDCHIRDAGLRILHRMIQSSSITIDRLRLSGNDLSSSCESYLANIVNKCAVKILFINHNNVGRTREFFTTILFSPSSTIEELFISNNHVQSEIAKEIFTLLKEKKTKLKLLSITNNNITDDAFDVIAETLQINTTLEYLNLFGNQISMKAIQLMLTSLHHNDVLENLLLPYDYSEDIKYQILEQRDIINKKRKERECHDHTTLQIKFSRF